MSSTWIVVADAARARVFAQQEGGLHERHDLTQHDADRIRRTVVGER